MVINVCLLVSKAGEMCLQHRIKAGSFRAVAIESHLLVTAVCRQRFAQRSVLDFGVNDLCGG